MIAKSLSRWRLLGGFSERHSDESVGHGLRVDDVLEAEQIVVQPRPSHMFTLSHTQPKRHENVGVTQCAPEATEFGEITQNKAITPFKVIQGHRFWYQSKAHIRLPISV